MCQTELVGKQNPRVSGGGHSLFNIKKGEALKMLFTLIIVSVKKDHEFYYVTFV